MSPATIAVGSVSNASDVGPALTCVPVKVVVIAGVPTLAVTLAAPRVLPAVQMTLA